MEKITYGKANFLKLKIIYSTIYETPTTQNFLLVYSFSQAPSIHSWIECHHLCFLTSSFQSFALPFIYFFYFLFLIIINYMISLAMPDTSNTHTSLHGTIKQQSHTICIQESLSFIMKGPLRSIQVCCFVLLKETFIIQERLIILLSRRLAHQSHLVIQ